MAQPKIEPTLGYSEGGWQQQWLWVDGEMRPWQDVTMPLTQATWSGLSAVFEGIKGYRSPAGRLGIFGLGEHLRRFHDSITFMRMTTRFTEADLAQACIDSLARNGIDDDCYLQPVAAPLPPVSGFYAPPVIGMQARVYIPVGPRPSQLMTDRRLRCNVTSWTRISDRTLPPRVKAIPNYQNSRVASLDSMLSGFDSPIFLNDRGTVAEGPGACIAIVRKGEVVTPPVTSGILESITRSFLLEMVPEALGLPMVEREIDRTELYAANEVFFLGTGAEINPVVSIDHYRIGSGEIGPMTRHIQRAYHDAVRGIDQRFAAWRTEV